MGKNSKRAVRSLRASLCQSLRHGCAVPPPFDSKGRL